MIYGSVITRAEYAQQILRLTRVERVLYTDLQRHKSSRSHLKMMMVRSRSSAFRTVVEQSITLKFSGKEQHIFISARYTLVRMSSLGNHEMVREYGIWIYKDVIFMIVRSHIRNIRLD